MRLDFVNNLPAIWSRMIISIFKELISKGGYIMSIGMSVIKVTEEYARGTFDCCLYSYDEKGECHYAKYPEIFSWYGHIESMVDRIMFKLYIRKGGKLPFCQQPMELTMQDLQYFESMSKPRGKRQRVHPNDTYYKIVGETMDHKMLRFVKAARKAINEGYHVYYYSD